MNIESLDIKTNFVFKLFGEISNGDLDYVYRGQFSNQIVSSIMTLARTNLSSSKDTSPMQSKIYFIMGEGLQNIDRHKIGEEIPKDRQSIFAIHKKNYKYYITSGNLIKTKEVDLLTKKLEHVNRLDKQGLRELSRKIRSSQGLSEKGGAGIGLIEMAKRSGNKLVYHFRKIDDEYSYFYLSTEIPTKNPGNPVDYQKYTLDTIFGMHSIFNQEDILLFFKGALNQKILLNLLSIVEARMEESATSARLFNIMIEMLQNIIKHSDNINSNESWKPGIFFISEENKTIKLTTGNYLQTKKKDKLARKIKCINKADKQKLDEIHHQILFDFDRKDALKTGLGLIEIKRKSNSPIGYNFHDVDNEYSFFTMQVAITQ